MCGICGQFNFRDSALVAWRDVEAMGRSMAHRGPDDEGYDVNGLHLASDSVVSKGGHQLRSQTQNSGWYVSPPGLCRRRASYEQSGLPERFTVELNLSDECPPVGRILRDGVRDRSFEVEGSAVWISAELGLHDSVTVYQSIATIVPDWRASLFG
jgi:hypothetical protein